MGLFFKQPVPEVRADTLLFRFKGGWSARCYCSGSSVEVVIEGNALSVSVAAYVAELAKDIDALSAKALSFAESQGRWPSEYHNPVLEEIVFPDGTDTSSFSLLYEMSPPMPPVYIDIEFVNGEPSNSKWDYV
ncbi:hypothetical protein HED60_03045 [Planctomycetales bacterium ZRK34]|nr:hypothetical protein HED60_03045 [Planctomycetales bacterium ZRK34]